VAGGLSLVLVLAAAGCDWLNGSDTGPRVSPYISDLRISRFSVLCNQAFTMNFKYDDPQKDIDQLILEFTQPAGVIRQTVAWPNGPDLTIQGTERAIYTYKFVCGAGNATGTWTISLQLQDEKSHLSNTLTGTISLLSN
jgi:hypothetical protein